MSEKSTQQDQGRFVWYELMTTDVKGGIDFYRNVIGWKTEAYENAPMEYTMWKANQGTLGGVMTLPEPAKQMGAPPHWQANVTVDDVLDTIAKVKMAGGQVFTGPNEIPNIGSFAVIADPQGAAITIFKPAGEMKSHDTTQEGEFSWNELATSDHEAAFKFYSTIFGWEKLDTMDMGEMGTYIIYGKDGKQLGGMFKKPAEMPVNAWLYYVHVNDLDAAVKRATDKGGKLLNGPMDVPGGDRIAQLIDPQGAMFALHEKVVKA